MSNPFLAPDAQTPTKSGDINAEVLDLVVSMRFPQLLLGGLYAIGALVLLVFGGLAFVGSIGAPMGGNETFVLQVMGASYAVMGALALVPSGLLVRSGLAAMVAPHEPEQVVTSLRAQLWFWRVLALYVLGSTLLYGLAFLVFVGIGIIAAL